MKQAWIPSQLFGISRSECGGNIWRIKASAKGRSGAAVHQESQASSVQRRPGSSSCCRPWQGTGGASSPVPPFCFSLTRRPIESFPQLKNQCLTTIASQPRMQGAELGQQKCSFTVQRTQMPHFCKAGGDSRCPKTLTRYTPGAFLRPPSHELVQMAPYTQYKDKFAFCKACCPE